MVEDEWDWEQLKDAIPSSSTCRSTSSTARPTRSPTATWPEIEKRLGEREKDLSREWLMYFLRHFYLEEIDQQWIEHLKTMDALREGIGLQGYGQKDPKKEYKKAGFTLFQEMMDRIRERRHQAVPRPDPARGRGHPGPAGKAAPDDRAAASPTRKTTTRRTPRKRPPRQAQRRGRGAHRRRRRGHRPVKRERPKVGRNDPCPCGSGKKYKKCHGKDEEASAEG